MTIQECYEKLGGDYARTERRLRNESLVKRLIAKFPDDDSFLQLCKAIQDGCGGEAFRAAHTLKGVSANLGFDRLMASAAKLTEMLRSEPEPLPEGCGPLLEEVRRDYEQTVCAIRAYLEQPSE